jgi:hypothetical protein
MELDVIDRQGTPVEKITLADSTFEETLAAKRDGPCTGGEYSFSLVAGRRGRLGSKATELCL